MCSCFFDETVRIVNNPLDQEKDEEKMANPQGTTEEKTPWSTLFESIKAALTGRPHPGQTKTVTIGNGVTVNDLFGGSIHGEYRFTVENHVDTPPSKH